MNKRGINFLIESAIVMLLLLAVVIGFIKYFDSPDNSYVLDYTKVSDAFIIFANENTYDIYRLRKIMSFIFPNENAELYVDDMKVYGNIDDTNSKTNCIIRTETIMVKELDVITPKSFKIKRCN